MWKRFLEYLDCMVIGMGDARLGKVIKERLQNGVQDN